MLGELAGFESEDTGDVVIEDSSDALGQLKVEKR